MTQMTYAPKKTVARARDLRRTMTLPEVLLWQHIRGRRLNGIRFPRQHPIGPYILDFFCEDARLAVEVDGESHAQPDAVEHDRRRTEWLNARCISVLRIPARDVLSELAAVVDHIQRQVRDQPPSTATRSPSPIGGGLKRPNHPIPGSLLTPFQRLRVEQRQSTEPPSEPSYDGRFSADASLCPFSPRAHPISDD